MMRYTKRDSVQRAGFTLLEILIVIGIIAVLVALIAAATAQIMLSVQKSASESTVQRVNEQMLSSYKDVNDQLTTEQIPLSVLQMAGNDTARAKVIWRKLRFKQEFPQSYAEAIFPWAVGGNPLPVTSGGLPQFISLSDLPPKPAYVRALIAAGLLPPNFVPANYVPTPLQPLPPGFGQDPEGEMGACLLMALSINRRGTNFDAEAALGPSAMKDTNGDGLKKIVDYWGKPLAFYRWPWANPDIATSTAAQATDRDPDDPYMLLQDAKWNNAASYAAQLGVYQFEQLCHPISIKDSQGNYLAPKVYYMLPTIVSAGPNGQFGLAWGSMAPLGPQANDNINSYMSKSMAH
jgi:prepilin-type N-terminal cleavage/methylation domain-containing protein